MKPSSVPGPSSSIRSQDSPWRPPSDESGYAAIQGIEQRDALVAASAMAASHLPPQIVPQGSGRENRNPRRPSAASRASIDVPTMTAAAAPRSAAAVAPTVGTSSRLTPKAGITSGKKPATKAPGKSSHRSRSSRAATASSRLMRAPP